MPVLPTSLALGNIGAGADILSADHRTNYSDIQSRFNALLALLDDGTAGDVLGGIGTTLAFSKPPGYLFDYAQITGSGSSTATSAATATAIVTGSAVTYDGATPVWIEFFAPAFQHTAITTVFFMLYDGATQVGRLFETNSVAANTDKPCFGKVKLTPSAGAHTYSIRVYSAGAGTATILAGAGGNDIDLPAFLAITKV